MPVCLPFIMSYHYLNYAATVSTMADNGDLVIGYKVLLGKVNKFCHCHVHVSNPQYCQRNIVILYLTQSTSHCKVTFMDLPVFCYAEGYYRL